MQLTRSRELTVRMGDYETLKFRAEIVASHQDLGISNEELAHAMTQDGSADIAKELQDYVAVNLDAALESDIQDAVAMATDRKSFLVRAYASANASDQTNATAKPKTLKRNL